MAKKKTAGLTGTPDAKRLKSPMKSVGQETRSKMGGTIAAQGKSKAGIK